MRERAALKTEELSERFASFCGFGACDSQSNSAENKAGMKEVNGKNSPKEAEVLMQTGSRALNASSALGSVGSTFAATRGDRRPQTRSMVHKQH